MAGEGSSHRRNVKTISSLLQSDGSWADSLLFCCPAPSTLDEEEYLRSYEGFYRKKGVSPPRFDSHRLHERWGKYESLKHKSTFNYGKWVDVVNGAFQIGNGYQWRVPTSNERLYSRPEDGSVAIPLDTLKAGLRPKPHHFSVALFKQEFKCSVAQFSPNAIRLILWFIAACAEKKL